MRHISQTVLLLVVLTVTFVEIEELDLCVKQVTFLSKINLCAYTLKEIATQFTDDMIPVDMPQPVMSTVMFTSTQIVSSTTSASRAPSCSVLISTTTAPVSSCSPLPWVGGGIPLSSSPLPWVGGGIPLSSSPLPWVGGGIIGAVLSTAILLTVLVAVCLLRRRKRRRTHSQHKM